MHIELTIAGVFVAMLAGCGPHGGALPAPGSVPNPGSAPTSPTVATVQWLQQGMNGAHVGYNKLETTLGVGNVANLTLKWIFSTGAQVQAPVLVQTGVVFADSGDGYLYAINAATGAQKWKFQTYNSNDGNPIIAGSRLIVGCLVAGNAQQDGVCALKLGTGALVWSYFTDCNCSPGSGVSAPLAAYGTTVVVPYRDRTIGEPYLVALNATTGAHLWSFEYPGGNNGGQENAAPAAVNGAVYISNGSYSNVCSLNLSNGIENWCSASTGDGYFESPAVANGAVYVNTTNGVYAFNGSTGATMWHYTPPAHDSYGSNDPPAIAKGRVYVSGTSSGNLYALNATTGALIYHTSYGSIGVTLSSSPSVANGVVYVQCNANSGGLCAFKTLTGALLLEASQGAAPYSSPAIVNGVVYLGCNYNDVCAYGLPAARKRMK